MKDCTVLFLSTVQRNFMIAMYIIFLGIIPSIILIMFLLYYSRHNVLPFWKRPRKSYVDLLPCTKRHGTTNNSKDSKSTNSSRSFFNNIPSFHYNTHRLRNMLNFHSKTPKNINKNSITVSQIDSHIYDVPDCTNAEINSNIQINFDYNKPLPEIPKNIKFDRKITKADIVINNAPSFNTKDQNVKSHLENAEEIKTNTNLNNTPLSSVIQNSNIINNTLPKAEISNSVSDINPIENSIVKNNELSVLIANAKNNLNKSPKPNNKNVDKPLVKVENDSNLSTVLTNARSNLSKSPKPTVKNVSNSVSVAEKELNSVPHKSNKSLPKSVNNINDDIKTSVVLKAKPKAGNKPNISNKFNINKAKPTISKAKPSIEKKELASTTNEMLTKGNVASKAHMFNKNDKDIASSSKD